MLAAILKPFNKENPDIMNIYFLLSLHGIPIKTAASFHSLSDDPFLLNNIQTNTDVTKQKKAPEMDLLDEFIAGNYPRSYEDDPADTFVVQGIASNGFLPHNESSDQWPQMPPPISSSPPYTANHQPYPLGFDGWTSLLGPNSDEMKCWKNTSIDKGAAALDLVSTSSQTIGIESEAEPDIPVSSIMSQTIKPVIAHDSTQTNRTRMKEKLCSTSDLVSVRNVACQTDSRVGFSTLKSTSSGCQTDVSIDWRKLEYDDEWSHPSDRSKEVIVQLCPRCHHVYKS